MDRSLQTQSPERQSAREQPRRRRKEMKTSRIGLDYPSFNAATVKRLANGFAKSHSKTKISKDTLAALVQTTDWFFEQIGEDLKAYAEHAGRKMIEESDVVAVMKRYVMLYMYYIHICMRQATSSNTNWHGLDHVRLPARTRHFPLLRRCSLESCYRNYVWNLRRSLGVESASEWRRSRKRRLINTSIKPISRLSGPINTMPYSCFVSRQRLLYYHPEHN